MVTLTYRRLDVTVHFVSNVREPVSTRFAPVWPISLYRRRQADSMRRHSSPVLRKSDRSNEIARLIGLVSAESQNLHGGGADHGSAALNELKSYVQQWPEAQATLEEQVARLKPRFRSFILEGCKAQPTQPVLRSTPLRGRIAAHRGQASEGVAFEVKENVLRPSAGTEVSHADQETVPARSNNRLQEIRRRMGTLGGPSREPAANTEDSTNQFDRWSVQRTLEYRLNFRLFVRFA